MAWLDLAARLRAETAIERLPAANKTTPALGRRPTPADLWMGIGRDRSSILLGKRGQNWHFGFGSNCRNSTGKRCRPGVVPAIILPQVLPGHLQYGASVRPWQAALLTIANRADLRSCRWPLRASPVFLHALDIVDRNLLFCFPSLRHLVAPPVYCAGHRRPPRFLHFMRLRFRRPLGVAIALVALVALVGRSRDITLKTLAQL